VVLKVARSSKASMDMQRGRRILTDGGNRPGQQGERGSVHKMPAFQAEEKRTQGQRSRKVTDTIKKLQILWVLCASP